MTIWNETDCISRVNNNDVVWTAFVVCVSISAHLDDECANDNGAEDKVVEDAFKDVPLAVDLAGIDFVEELHQHKGVEDNGVVFRWRCVERGVTAAVYIEQLFT